jgi:DNA-binding XRE family transcriptional regulator
MTTRNEKMRRLPASRRKRIEGRAAELIAEEMSLRDLRRAHRKTQEAIAKSLGISQDGISRLETRSDMLISTMRKFVEAMGGRLSLIAKFPDRPPVTLTGLAALENARARTLSPKANKKADAA